MNFDQIKDRRGGHTSKWGAMAERTGATADDAIAMWVADMDFDAPDCAKAVLRQEADSGFLGYFGNAGPVSDAVCNWLHSQHGWDAKPDWIRYTNGVVAGFATVLEAFTDPGDSVVLFTPVYHAFFIKAAAMGRAVTQSPLVEEEGRYNMDLDALAGQLTGREKVVVLCSPHNPCGRLWTAEEIAALTAFCEAHDLILLSDEIHMDLTFPDAVHLPSAVAAPDAVKRLITITAASKSFNIAGLETGFALIEDPDLRARFDIAHKKMGGTPNRIGMQVLKAVLTEGADWSVAVRGYLADNFLLWRDRIGALPGVRVMDMQATYLSWVDFENTGLSPDEVEKRLSQDARLGVSPGAQFGEGGKHFNRFNIAMPRPLLIEAIERIEAAFADLQ